MTNVALIGYEGLILPKSSPTQHMCASDAKTYPIYLAFVYLGVVWQNAHQLVLFVGRKKNVKPSANQQTIVNGFGGCPPSDLR